MRTDNTDQPQDVVLNRTGLVQSGEEPTSQEPGIEPAQTEQGQTESNFFPALLMMETLETIEKWNRFLTRLDRMLTRMVPYIVGSWILIVLIYTSLLIYLAVK